MSAGDADPGALLRRRRREVALCIYNIRKQGMILDGYPTLNLRFLFISTFGGWFYYQLISNRFGISSWHLIFR